MQSRKVLFFLFLSNITFLMMIGICLGFLDEVRSKNKFQELEKKGVKRRFKRCAHPLSPPLQ